MWREQSHWTPLGRSACAQLTKWRTLYILLIYISVSSLIVTVKWLYRNGFYKFCDFISYFVFLFWFYMKKIILQLIYWVSLLMMPLVAPSLALEESFQWEKVIGCQEGNVFLFYFLMNYLWGGWILLCTVHTINFVFFAGLTGDQKWFLPLPISTIFLTWDLGMGFKSNDSSISRRQLKQLIITVGHWAVAQALLARSLHQLLPEFLHIIPRGRHLTRTTHKMVCSQMMYITLRHMITNARIYLYNLT